MSRGNPRVNTHPGHFTGFFGGAGVKSWKFRDVVRGVGLDEGVAVQCLAGQPGVCFVTATPVVSN